MVLWASAFVLLSLLINAPSIGPVMRWTGLRCGGRLVGMSLGCCGWVRVPWRQACSYQQLRAPSAPSPRVSALRLLLAPQLPAPNLALPLPCPIPTPACPSPCPCSCSRISPDRVRGRKRALEELQSFTAASIDELKQQQDGEFLQGETPRSCWAVLILGPTCWLPALWWGGAV